MRPSTYTTKRQDAPNLLRIDENALPHEPQVDKLLQKYLHSLSGYLKKRKGYHPGAAVMVRKNDEIVHLNCYGYANLETEKEITPTTLFDLGSLSKQFTAIAALNLVINNELKLDDRLSTFFNDFPRYADKVTVNELIHHTSAIPEYLDLYGASREVNENWYKDAIKKPDEWYPQMAKREPKEITNKDVLGWIALQRLLPREPNTLFEYSNSGYVVLAEVIEKVAEAPFSTYLNDRIFDPLGMTSTFVFDENRAFADDAPEVVNHARCYNRLKEGFVPIGYTPMNFVYGDGNVQSNILDLAKWDHHLHGLDHAAICARDPAKEEAAERIRDLLWDPVEVKGRRRIDYGAGWNLLRIKYEKQFEEDGRRFTRKYESHGVYHRGEWLGWRSYIARAARWVVPEPGREIDPRTWDSLGIVILSNNSQFNVGMIAQRISQMFWGELRKDNIMNSFV